jgi:hypothetical protein
MQAYRGNRTNEQTLIIRHEGALNFILIRDGGTSRLLQVTAPNELKSKGGPSSLLEELRWYLELDRGDIADQGSGDEDQPVV